VLADIVAFRLIMVTACMSSNGGQKGHVPPITGGKQEYWGQLQKIFAFTVFHNLFHPNVVRAPLSQNANIQCRQDTELTAGCMRLKCLQLVCNSLQATAVK